MSEYKPYHDLTDREKRADYHNTIQMSADVIEDQLVEYDVPGSELVFDQIDTSQWIVYTSRNIDVLRFANNDPEEWSIFVSEDERDWRRVINAMAFTAMRMDLYDELHDRDVDI